MGLQADDPQAKPNVGQIFPNYSHIRAMELPVRKFSHISLNPEFQLPINLHVQSFWKRSGAAFGYAILARYIHPFNWFFPGYHSICLKFFTIIADTNRTGIF